MKNLQLELSRLTRSDDYRFAIIPGSGTTGMESAIMSSQKIITVSGMEGRFTARWRSLATHYNGLGDRNQEDSITLGCTYETSVNRYDGTEFGMQDSICSFPYYDLSGSPALFVCSSNKMLGAMAGVAIVAVREERLHEFDSGSNSTLALSHFFLALDKNETPYTCPTGVMEDLLKSISVLDVQELRDKIDLHASFLLDAFPNEAFIGDVSGPVMTIKREYLSDELCREWDLYEKTHPHKCVQIFLYSCETNDYEKFGENVKKMRVPG